jgi:copper ion binding protein
MNTTTVTVMGMSCGGCVSSVREEIGDIPGVNTVDVELSSGTVIIESDGPVETGAIENAIEEAGYQLAS